MGSDNLPCHICVLARRGVGGRRQSGQTMAVKAEERVGSPLQSAVLEKPPTNLCLTLLRLWGVPVGDPAQVCEQGTAAAPPGLHWPSLGAASGGSGHAVMDLHLSTASRRSEPPCQGAGRGAALGFVELLEGVFVVPAALYCLSCTRSGLCGM